ncbi:MAG TPA: Hsp20/alpha crystallin family protein [Candidatus Eisenbergiella merdavium]|uniref:Hsp20/alpha crystallin family protein n=1 Tax=Candidatus Eisenbergiella merdavium TaxID=2838551 RepID=A0A9D2NEC7_9FIRM|nr:Hsp20/alpha crystallin family protein [Candidatus Eisenbergiella merdavium]
MLLPSIFGEDLFDDWMDFPFDDKFDKRLNKELYGRKNPVFGKNAARIMKTDVREKKDSYEVDVDLPGFKKEQIQVSLENGYLTISAEKGLDKDEDRGSRYIRRERFSGSCRRTFYVGENLEQSDIKACFRHGILKLTIPKKVEKPTVEENRYISIEG